MFKNKAALYLGTMTGTSLDGIDVALIDCSHKVPQFIQAHHYEYPAAIRQKLLNHLAAESISLTELNALDTEIGQVIAASCNNFLTRVNVPATNILAIGMHGQTICHTPNHQYPNSLQIGNPNVVCQATGIDTVSDFRRADIAQGGQGAPLVPAFHQAIFQTQTENRLIINIGGIANLTYLPRGPNQPIEGFDIGPGNALMDAWIYLHSNLEYDDMGQVAAQGNVDNDLLNTFLADPFFNLPAPKSTGKEHFNLKWVHQGINGQAFPLETVQATLCELTAVSIARACQMYPSDSAIYLCGGGTKNQYLVTRLQRHLATQKINTTSELGFNPQWIEASAFAWLAQCRIEAINTSSHTITGATKATHLGALYLA